MSDDEDRGRRARERVASLRAMASQRYGDDREFGAERRLKAARLGAGYKTAADAARALGVAEQTYFAHESGRRGLRSDALERYAEGFGVSKEWLLFGEDRPREPAIQAAVREDPTEWQGSPTDIGHPLQAKNRSISGYVYIDYTIHRDPPAWLSLDQIYIPPPEDPMIEYFFICSSLTFEAGRSYIFGDLLGVRRDQASSVDEGRLYVGTLSNGVRELFRVTRVDKSGGVYAQSGQWEKRGDLKLFASLQLSPFFISSDQVLWWDFAEARPIKT